MKNALISNLGGLLIIIIAITFPGPVIAMLYFSAIGYIIYRYNKDGDL